MGLSTSVYHRDSCSATRAQSQLRSPLDTFPILPSDCISNFLYDNSYLQYKAGVWEINETFYCLRVFDVVSFVYAKTQLLILRKAISAHNAYQSIWCGDSSEQVLPPSGWQKNLLPKKLRYLQPLFAIDTTDLRYQNLKVLERD